MKMGKVEKLIGNLYDKKRYVLHVRNLKQTLNHGLELKKCIESLCSIKQLCSNRLLISIQI